MYLKLYNFYYKVMNFLQVYTASKYAVPILATVAFTESSFFIIPPDVLLIPMAFAMPRKALFYALITTLFSVLGGVFGYAIGYFAYDLLIKDLIEVMHYQKHFDNFQAYYDKYGLMAIFIAGFTPLPYKVATIASGIFNMNIFYFVLVSILSRGLRFFLLATIIKLFHQKGIDYIAKYFKHIMIGSIVALLLAIILFIILKQYN
jgi:membrane protein YqaA with SNARE-associated domain